MNDDKGWHLIKLGGHGVCVGSTSSYIQKPIGLKRLKLVKTQTLRERDGTDEHFLKFYVLEKHGDLTFLM